MIKTKTENTFQINPCNKGKDTTMYEIKQNQQFIGYIVINPKYLTQEPTEITLK